jgi:hypothetical protein
MTHDELLAKIDNFEPDYELDSVNSMNALYAVVELCNFLDKKGHCCVPVKEVIQAIEKELG